MKVALSLLALILGGCVDAQPPRDAGGRAANEPTIVSLNPCTDAILAEVAEPEQVLALSHYSHDPRASSMPQDVARRFAVTGGTAEEVMALAPDVVLADSFTPPATSAAFARLGMRVESFGIAGTAADSIAQIRRVAAVAGHPAKGEALVRRIEMAMAETRYDGAPIAALMWQSGEIVPGENSLAGRLLEHTGFASHSAARGLGQGAHLPLEQVLADPPALVLAAGGERALNHPVLAQLPATRTEQIDPALFFCGGPSIIGAVHRLAELRAGFP